MAAASRDIAQAREALRDGDLAHAARLLKRILSAQPAHAAANELMGYVEARRGDKGRALECLRAATRSAEASGAAWYYLARLQLEEGAVAEAAESFARALSVEPGLFEALHDLGRLLHEQGRHAEAADRLRAACAANPRSFEARHNLARALHALGRPAEALVEYDEALALDPRSAETWLNRGETLHDLGRLDEGLQSYARARALRPDYPEAEANEGVARLTAGDWEAGWKAFEARFRGEGALLARHRGIARWKGEPLEGKRIVAWSEQGFGDTLQFCRFVAPLVEAGADVVFETQAALQPLLERNLPCRVVAQGEPVGDCDFQVPAMSLAGILHVTPDKVPARVPYIRAPEEKVRQWSARIARADAKPKVAIACSGRATHKHERRRRVRLRDFAGLDRMAHLFLLQKEIDDADRAALAAGEVAAEFLGEEIVDFRDGAGILASVDLVICVDTSIGHLAGAMARPVWLLLMDVPDWRWMLGRTDTPWYPTMKLFRQERAGDWPGVFARVRDALEEFTLRDRGSD